MIDLTLQQGEITCNLFICNLSSLIYSVCFNNPARIKKRTKEIWRLRHGQFTSSQAHLDRKCYGSVQAQRQQHLDVTQATIGLKYKTRRPSQRLIPDDPGLVSSWFKRSSS